eukprot:CAMPEP_0195291976 /NCGR_PEP_ID=MMETSP0707-20130614/8541_1 /TAXON_ID=33640 /ORGANISM="Asterionellopsis glacialis, Strain CCMP134" /LENGTH=704 /DNA_ID=CAMNT_0040352347 /DNA_START=150 /DNA_END=2264 /DNA_ORIENTATION=-
MKFGHTLHDRISEEWYPYTVDYKGLKRVLKGKDPVKGEYIHNPHTSSHVDDHRDDCDDPATIDKNAFFRLYEDSKTKLEVFYEDREKSAHGKLRAIEERVGQTSPEDSSDASIKQLIDTMDEFEHDINELMEFLDLNKTGFSKILKKFDKNTGMCVRETKLAELLSTHNFLEGQRLKELRDRLFASHDQILEILASRLDQGEDDDDHNDHEEDYSELTNEMDRLNNSSIKSKELSSSLGKRRLLKMSSREAKIAETIDLVEKDSLFFPSHPPRNLPTFKHKEIYRGNILGEGEFGTVREIREFRVPENCHACYFHRSSLPKTVSFDLLNAQVGDVEQEEETNDHTNNIKGEQPDAVISRPRINSCSSLVYLDSVVGSGEDIENVEEFFDDHEDESLHNTRGFMKDHCMREDLPRYAIKGLRDDLAAEWIDVASRDIAVEAKFLASLSHPNIVKLRGTGGVPGHQNYFLVLDRLYGTLTEKCIEWKTKKIKAKGSRFFMKKDTRKLEDLWVDRLVAVFDVARAMKYLHERKILFRDLKPDNVGFDIRGDAKIFDFGLAKELHPRDEVGTDQFRLSGVTGSRRYMAPEVAICDAYGMSADVYSFAIMMWEVLALETPFKDYGYEKHAKLVVLKGQRPRVPKSWPVLLRKLTKEAWSPKPSVRPTFSRICDALRAEVSARRVDLTDRENDLLQRSENSMIYQDPNSA